MSNSVLSAFVESCNGHYIESSDLSRQEKFGLWMRLLWVLSGVLFVYGLLLVLTNTSESMAVGCIWVAVITGGQVMVTSLMGWQVKEGDRAYGHIRDLLSPCGGSSGGSHDVFHLWVMSVDMKASTVSMAFFGGLYVIALLFGTYVDGALFDVLTRSADDEILGVLWLLVLWLQLLSMTFFVWKFARVWSFFIGMNDGEERDRLEGLYGDLQVVFCGQMGGVTLPYGRACGRALGAFSGDAMQYEGDCVAPVSTALDMLPSGEPGSLVVDSFSIASSSNIDYSESAAVRQDGRNAVAD